MRWIRRGSLVGWVVGVVVGLGLLGGCKRKVVDPVEAVRAAVVAIEDAVEAGDLGAVRERVSEGYSDPQGNDKGGLVGMLQVRLLQRRSVHVMSRIGEIRIIDEGEGATAEVLAAAGSVPIAGVEALASLNADLFRLDLEFERDGDEWLLRSARWRRASRGEFDEE